MIEAIGDLWTYPCDVRCIATNGAVRRDGTAVMGKGTAGEANTRWPGLNRMLGDQLRKFGNRVLMLGIESNESPIWIWAFPTKHHWMEKADLALIAESCRQATEMANAVGEKLGRPLRLALPRPGCGARTGQLDWETQVRPVVQDLLDDRFHVITNTP